MPVGIVKWWNHEKGFGFLTPDVPGRDIFVHHTHLAAAPRGSDGLITLPENARVVFGIEQGEKGPKAANVRVIEPGVEARWSVQRDAEGQWVTVERPAPSLVVGELRAVSGEVIRTLGRDPRSMYSLSSRQFEEVVAELLARRGYSVELTPVSRDGGCDIYAAKSDAVGSFLYLVECKKYAPERRVGVGLVRQLHGVVQQNRATAGVLATTSFFTRGAQDFADTVKWQLSLRDYISMTEWLEDSGFGN